MVWGPQVFDISLFDFGSFLIGSCDPRWWESRFWTSNLASCTEHCRTPISWVGDFYFATLFGFENLCAFYSAGFAFNQTCPSVLLRTVAPKFSTGVSAKSIYCPTGPGVFCKTSRCSKEFHFANCMPLLLFPDNRLPCRIPTGNVNHPWDICVLCMSGNTHSFFRLASKNHKKTTPWVADAKLFSKSGFCVNSGVVLKGFGLTPPKAEKKK